MPADCGARSPIRARAADRRRHLVRRRCRRRHADPAERGRRRVHQRPPRGPDPDPGRSRARSRGGWRARSASCSRPRRTCRPAPTPAGGPGGGAAAARRARRSWPARCRRRGRGSGCGSPTRTQGDRRRAAGRRAGDAGRRCRGDRVQRPVRVVASTWFGTDGTDAGRGRPAPAATDHAWRRSATRTAWRRRPGSAAAWSARSPVRGSVARCTIERLDERRDHVLAQPRRRISTLGRRLPRPPRGDRRSVDPTTSPTTPRSACA